jgi:tRNA threonylcarbamoyladenosine biosynthesis protein TsaE
MKTYLTSSSEETKKLGEELARKFLASYSLPPTPRRALVLALQGELGSGKTTFVQGFLRGLGIKKRSASPTFIIMRRFKIKNCKLKNLYHIDAYRIRKPQELLALGAEDIFADHKNIVLVEWADDIKTILPRNCRWIRFSHGRKENERTIKL